MSGRRGRTPKTRPPPSVANASRSSLRRKNKSQEQSDVPDVFQELLAQETQSQELGQEEDARPLKRRKTRHTTLSTGSSTFVPKTSNDHGSASASLGAGTQQETNTDDQDGTSESRIEQTIEISSESDDSDMEWEDVPLVQDDSGDQEEETADEPVINDITITIGQPEEIKTPTKRVRRKGITAVDKKLRLDIHKMHVLCLLYHVHRRNAWCNDARVQQLLRKLPSPQTLSNLAPDPDLAQTQASKNFITGIQEIKALWANRFSATALGMHRPRWNDAESDRQPFSAFDELDPPMDKRDFVQAAVTLQGSQDVGAQLFCAMLRGIGLEARLVCSLQCLPFAAVAQAPSSQPPSSNHRNSIVLDPYNSMASPGPSKPSGTPSRPKRLSRLERVLGERSAALNTPPPPKKKKYHSPYPVYWVEVFNQSTQKWITVDPHATSTVDKPHKLEPPLNYPYNMLCYAVAFEEDLTAKDVTRRYAKAYNAKTRKFRVECTEDGARWWTHAMSMFQRLTPLDRDQLEDAALARKEAGEGLPKNVQDFKDHPVYVLERHLRHNEVIHPKNQVGKINLGTAFNPKMEPVYRRRDVRIVKSADRWYRLGRDVKDGEQPLKHAKPRKGARRLDTPDEEGGGGEELGAGLYAHSQTTLYVPPPVVNGRVPRNVYGNLDVYVPSMIPTGGAHIRRQHASKAARLIGVDYADVVTGFQFKGRQGTAVLQGIVVAEEYAEAVDAVLDAMEYAQERAENAARTAEALRLWRRFFLGLKIAQRVNAMEIDGEKGNVQEELDMAEQEVLEEQLAGGFFPAGGPVESEVAGGGFFPAAAELAEPSGSASLHRRSAPSLEDSDVEGAEAEAGGFLPDETEGPGGFLADEDDDDGDGDAASGGFFPPEGAVTFGSSLLARQDLTPRKKREAGGFIFEADEMDNVVQPDSPLPPSRDTGGGFFPEDSKINGMQVESPPPPPAPPAPPPIEPRDETNELILPATMEINTRETSSSEKLASPSHSANNPTTPTPDPPPVVQTEQFKGPALASPSPPTHSAPVPITHSDISDTGSLPLDDSDDEDAEPDWLLDAT